MQAEICQNIRDFIAEARFFFKRFRNDRTMIFDPNSPACCCLGKVLLLHFSCSKKLDAHNWLTDCSLEWISTTVSALRYHANPQFD